MKILLIILLGISFLGCTNSKDTRYQKKHILLVENQIMKINSGEEDFNSFFENFIKDTIFQKNRIIFPFERIVSYILPNGANADSINILNAKNYWIHCSFMLNDSVKFPFQLTEKKDDTTVVILMESESDNYFNKGIQAEFILIAGKWVSNKLAINLGLKK
jgi:hypothetical protein